MPHDWKSWCRLCASGKAEFKVESLQELNNILQVHFNISLTELTGVSVCICAECFNFTTKLEHFGERCKQTNRLLLQLSSNGAKCVSEGELQLLRTQYLTDYGHSTTEVLEEAMDSEAVVDKDSTKEGFNATETPFEIVQGQDLIQLKEEDLSDFDLHFNTQPEEDTCEDDSDIVAYADVTEQEEDVKSLPRQLRRLAQADAASEEELSTKEYHVPRKKGPRTVFRNKRPSATTFEIRFPCSKCSKTYRTEERLKLHQVIHSPNSQRLRYPCRYCDKKFSKIVNVQTHIRVVHKRERPFVCEECGKSLGTKGALKEHKIVHSDEKPFQCAKCPKRFKNSSRLKIHQDIHNDTLYVCPHCGLQLNTKRTLNMHMVVHSDQKKFKCQYCGNEYKRSKALKNHLILHTGLRPYQCPFCEKTFANGSNCRSHKKKAHPKELEALEASGSQVRTSNIPKLEHLQPKSNQPGDDDSHSDMASGSPDSPYIMDDRPSNVTVKHEECNGNLNNSDTEQSSIANPNVMGGQRKTANSVSVSHL